ncbi:N-acetyltransferase [Brevundimonas sp. S30B]|uniref:GNAT family N-acetyltransferase n=1 Tax=unclassified Brevundimonas TaxID=2622653 RepID=UPI001072C554|nr:MULTISPECIES: GNAT family protein [unclassified Brevundimonas]QBX37505.1 N-acetyltransferase [Brevundimonas sp. MF30-B]TFW03702.1 N-acetyltransferase [Brevundimonas sp. S30B]
MALLDWMSETTGPLLEGHGVVLRPPRPSDHVQWATLRERSREYLQPWEPRWPEDDLSRTAFKRRLQLYAREMENGTAWPFFIFDRQDQALVGAATLSNIRRGVAETGTLGYWIGQRFAGRGYATAGVRAVVAHAFGPLRLHRVEAACLPSNIASRRVLEKSGFRKEGEARAYLKINGDWADHWLFGVVADDVGSGEPPPA